MFRVLYRFLSALARLAVRSGRSKNLEIIVLRHQLTVLRRQTERPSIDDNDRTVLGAIAAALPRRLRHGWIVTPETLLRWHRRRIAQHRTQPSQQPGRPPTSAKIARLVVEMATNNPTSGYRRITAELNRLGHRSDRSLILGHGERLHQTRALVRDRGSQFVDSFDEIFRTEGLRILRTPVRTPVANTFAERWIGTLRRELLDRTIIWYRRQLPPVPGPPSSSMSSPLSLLAVKQILSPLAA